MLPWLLFIHLTAALQLGMRNQVIAYAKSASRTRAAARAVAALACRACAPPPPTSSPSALVVVTLSTVPPPMVVPMALLIVLAVVRVGAPSTTHEASTVLASRLRREGPTNCSGDEWVMRGEHNWPKAWPGPQDGASAADSRLTLQQHHTSLELGSHSCPTRHSQLWSHCSRRWCCNSPQFPHKSVAQAPPNQWRMQL